MLSKSNKGFPRSFISIDGGTYRECSIKYQKIIKTVSNKKYGGLKDLVLSGFSLTRKSLFN